MGERGKLVATLAREAGFCFCREAAACLHALQRLAIGVEVQLLGSIGAHGAGARAAAGAGGGLGEHTGACGKRMQSIHKHHTAPKGAQSLLAPACTLAGFQRVQQDARQRAPGARASAQRKHLFRVQCGNSDTSEAKPNLWHTHPSWRSPAEPPCRQAMHAEIESAAGFKPRPPRP